MPSLLLKNPRKTLTGAAIALVCLVGTVALQKVRLDEIKAVQDASSLQAIEQETSATRSQLELLQKLPAFGFDNLVADWTFLQFLQYFGNTPAREQTGYRLSPDFFEVILDHDPYFREAYFFLSGSTTLYAGMPERSVEIMNEKLTTVLTPEQPPGAYYIWRFKGIDELLFLGDAAAAQNSFERAAEWASIYNDPESQAVAQTSQQTAQFLAQNPDSTQAQIGAWAMVLTNAFDENTQELAVRRIEALGGQVDTDEQGRLRIRLGPATE